MKTPLKYPGAKQRIADWIISHFGEHRTYLELFFGGGSVLFNKTPSKIETVNDLDDEVINLFRIIRESPHSLTEAIKNTPYARSEYNNACKEAKSPAGDIEKARRFLVRCWQGFGYRTRGEKVGWKTDIAGREAAYALRAWNDVPTRIQEAAKRLKNVQIEQQDAIKLAQRYNSEKVLIYADPPYLLSTRSKKMYAHEMTDSAHMKLLETLLQHKGQVVLSGYDNQLYNETLQGWQKVQISARAELGRKRIETLWIKERDI